MRHGAMALGIYPPRRVNMLRRFGQALKHWWLSRYPRRRRPLKQELSRFLGHGFMQLQTHDKNFPGYDLASVNLALASVLGECCSQVRTLGGCCALNLRAL